jgi:hypothetical protein
MQFINKSYIHVAYIGPYIEDKIVHKTPKKKKKKNCHLLIISDKSTLRSSQNLLELSCLHLFCEKWK